MHTTLERGLKGATQPAGATVAVTTSPSGDGTTCGGDSVKEHGVPGGGSSARAVDGPAATPGISAKNAARTTTVRFIPAS